jgi:hypothetical protein
MNRVSRGGMKDIKIMVVPENSLGRMLMGLYVLVWLAALTAKPSTLYTGGKFNVAEVYYESCRF